MINTSDVYSQQTEIAGGGIFELVKAISWLSDKANYPKRRNTRQHLEKSTFSMPPLQPVMWFQKLDFTAT